MSTSPKDPGETITVTFDFSRLTTSVSSPSVAISVEAGSDADPEAIRSGTPQVSGALVLQQIVAGLSGVSYHLRCTATGADGSVFVIAGTLPVYTF